MDATGGHRTATAKPPLTNEVGPATAIVPQGAPTSCATGIVAPTQATLLGHASRLAIVNIRHGTVRSRARRRQQGHPLGSRRGVRLLHSGRHPGRCRRLQARPRRHRARREARSEGSPLPLAAGATATRPATAPRRSPTTTAPSNLNRQHDRARRFMQLKQHDLALADLSRAETADPQSAMPAVMRAGV